LEEISALNKAKAAMNRDSRAEVQAGRLGVELSIQGQNLRQDYLPSGVAVKVFQGRKLFENGGIWVDESFKADVKSLIVKSQSRAYFQLLESRPELKELFLVSNYLVWMTPGGTALVIDATQGREELEQAEIQKLFSSR
jgi:Ca-activated chloride channel homolog